MKLLAYGTIMVITLVNSMSVKASNYLNIITMASKLFVLSLIAVAGIYNIAIGKNIGLIDAFEGSSTNPASYAVGFYTCMWSYGGWERICQCYEEVKNPNKNIPIIIIVSILIIGSLYLTVNVAYFTVMTKEEFLASPAVAITFANRVFPNFAWIAPSDVQLKLFF